VPRAEGQTRDKRRDLNAGGDCRRWYTHPSLGRRTSFNIASHLIPGRKGIRQRLAWIGQGGRPEGDGVGMRTAATLIVTA
jgi:hypothetical protein